MKLVSNLGSKKAKMGFCDLHSRKLKQRIPYGYYRRWLEAESLKLGTEIYPHIMKIVNNVKEMLKVLGMKLTGFFIGKAPPFGDLYRLYHDSK